MSRRVAHNGVRLAPIGRSKYGAVKTKVDGITFASKAEARRYYELKLLQQAGEIVELKLQPSFALMAPIVSGGLVDINAGIVVGMRVVGVYRGDFKYYGRDGELHIEDVKGWATPQYRWKRKHVEIQYGVTITEVR